MQALRHTEIREIPFLRVKTSGLGGRRFLQYRAENRCSGTESSKSSYDDELQ